MELGFETVGNATLIVHDQHPIVATDPWVCDWAYFGSWALSHEVPTRQMESIDRCPYIWFSHGHPDHLNANNLERFKNKTILLADHVGSRIHNGLVAEGFRVKIMEDRKWYPLSERVSALCVSDFNQDSVLLLNIGDQLVVNLNDAGNNGSFSFVKGIIPKFDTSYLLALTGFGDANMINFHDESGKLILPPAAEKKPVGKQIQELVESFGATHFIPFSSLHQYQRSDSIWANEYVTHVKDYPIGFHSKSAKLLPAFIQVDCLTGEFSEIKPQEIPGQIIPCGDFGDNWSDPLSKEDLVILEDYFKSAEFLSKYLDFINLRVGSKDHIICFNKSKFSRGVTFQTPRFSLVEAAKHEVFDDLLIGNFMKTTLHGNWPESKLFPSFDGHLAKYADNGRAKTKEQVRDYFRAYIRRAPLDMISHFAMEKGKDVFRTFVKPGSRPYEKARFVYKQARRFV